MGCPSACPCGLPIVVPWAVNRTVLWETLTAARRQRRRERDREQQGGNKQGWMHCRSGCTSCHFRSGCTLFRFNFGYVGFLRVSLRTPASGIDWCPQGQRWNKKSGRQVSMVASLSRRVAALPIHVSVILSDVFPFFLHRVTDSAASKPLSNG